RRGLSGGDRERAEGPVGGGTGHEPDDAADLGPCRHPASGAAEDPGAGHLSHRRAQGNATPVRDHGACTDGPAQVRGKPAFTLHRADDPCRRFLPRHEPGFRGHPALAGTPLRKAWQMTDVRISPRAPRLDPRPVAHRVGLVALSTDLTIELDFARILAPAGIAV